MTSDGAGSVPDGLLEIGRIGAPHGLKGELTATLTSNVDDRLAPGAELWCVAGLLTVEASQPHGARWLVRFAGCTDRDGAERLRGLVLYAEPVTDPDELWIHELIGASVVDSEGVPRGTVTEVLDNPAADLLVLDGGALVPLTFVVSFADGVIRVDTPPGLFD